jgi:hypothetical protein
VIDGHLGFRRFYPGATLVGRRESAHCRKKTACAADVFSIGARGSTPLAPEERLGFEFNAYEKIFYWRVTRRKLRRRDTYKKRRSGSP